MKKFIIALVFILTANFACKKEGIDPGACGCSPIFKLEFFLVFKSAQGDDLLNSGSYTKGQIQLYYLDDKGVQKDIEFTIRPPFTYGNNKYNFNQLYSTSIINVAIIAKQKIYLKMVDQAPLELKLEFDQYSRKITKVTAGQNELDKEQGEILKYIDAIYYLTL